MTAHRVTHDRLELGESCRWDEVTQRLCWVDVLTGRLFEAEAEAEADAVTEVRCLEVGAVVTALAPVADRSGWLVAVDQGLALLARDGGLTPLVELEGGKGGRVRMNDGACDPRGRFWVGSMAYDAAPGAGSLYRVDLDGSWTKVLGDLTISNGIGWSPDGSRMYHVDSGAATITAYDFDLDKGEISAPTSLVVLSGGGVPDGLCVDREGYLWVAIWGAGEVHRYTPEGQQVCVVEVPASQPSSCALGGPYGRELFITTARHGAADADLARQQESGCLFAVTVDVPGQPIQPFLGAPATGGAAS
jgi:sugar lactone lactonase YvrE